MHQLYVETYLKDENCDWLVLLHGFGGSTQMWKKQVESFKENHNLLILDLPGHGKSSSGIAGRGIDTFEEIADIVVGVMKDHKIQEATFICVSLGTLVFAGILSKYPEVVKGAILSGAVFDVHTFWKVILKTCNAVRYCFPYTVLLNIFSGVLLPLRGHQTSRKFFLKSGRLMGRQEFMAWFDLFVRDMDALVKLPELANLKENLLIIVGKEDFTFVRGVKDKISSLKKSKLKVMKKCGHVCNIQKWQEFNDVSLEFINTTKK